MLQWYTIAKLTTMLSPSYLWCRPVVLRQDTRVEAGAVAGGRVENQESEVVGRRARGGGILWVELGE